MIKLNQTASSNVTVLPEAQLTEVVGGRGHRGGHRRNNYRNCYDNNRRYDDCSYGYESKGCDDSYDSSYCYDDSSDYCERQYS